MGEDDYTGAGTGTQDGVWYTWTTGSASSTANLYTTPDATWNQWTTTTAGTANATTTIVWNAWVSDTTTASYQVTTTDATWSQWVVAGTGQYQPQGYQPYTPPTAEQQDAWAREHAEVERKANEKAAERAAAVVKAKALLASMLDEQQRAQLERDKFFDFVSQTGRKMRIKSHSQSMNVDELGEDGKRIRTLCAHPASYELPVEDHMVAQFLTLRHDEEAFLRVANVRM